MEPRAPFRFPDGFLWGAATAAHQVEGGTENNWSVWEREHATRLAGEAEKKFGHLRNWPAIKDAARDPQNYISGRACDHWNRYEEDLDIARSLNLNAFRFSIEWSRIEPNEGTFDSDALAHYQRVVDACRARGLEPFVTLWHWTMPLWLARYGYEEGRRFPFYFARFAEYAVRRLNGVRYWMTLNEPTVVAFNAYLRGEWPPQKKSYFAAWRVMRRLAAAHRAAYAAIRRAQPEAQIGFGNSMAPIIADSSSVIERMKVAVRDFFANRYFLRLTRGTNDYYAIQYYSHFRTDIPGAVMNDMGWPVYPKGLYDLLLRFKNSGKPVFITENGIADAADAYRERFIRDHVAAAHRAIQKGVPVRGYFYWSLLDNFEWDKGFWPRFGLVEMEYATMKRTVRPSGKFYAQTAKQNQIS